MNGFAYNHLMSSRSLLVAIALMLSTSTSYLNAQWSDWVAPAEANDLKNPLAGDPSDVQQGKALFSAICFVCHGNEGKGDGINAPSLAKPPADLTSRRVQRQSDGILFWKISEGNPPMLSFKGALNETQRWQMVEYIRELAKNASNDVVVENKSGGKLSSAEKQKKPSSSSQSTVSTESQNTNVTNPYKEIQDGQTLFKFICGACHTIGKGKLVGPDLKMVSERHSEEWLLKWVRSSQTLVKAGDPEAIKLFEENNKVIMPDQPFLSSSQIKMIFDYIQLKSKPKIVSIGGAPSSGKVQKTQRIYQPITLGLAGYVLIGGLFFFVGTMFYIVILLSRMVAGS